MGDGRCGVFEKREKTTNKRDGRRERRGEKSAAKIWKSGKRTDAQVLRFLHFFPPLSSAWCCPLPLKFCAFFLKKARVFLLLFCASTRNYNFLKLPHRMWRVICWFQKACFEPRGTESRRSTTPSHGNIRLRLSRTETLKRVLVVPPTKIRIWT